MSGRHTTGRPQLFSLAIKNDAMASLLIAELANTLTDPNFRGWHDKLGLGIADKCAWNFGTTYRAPNGALANVQSGGKHFLLQQLWSVSKKSGQCAMQ